MGRMTLISQVTPPVEEDSSLVETVVARQPDRAAAKMWCHAGTARQELPEHFERLRGATCRSVVRPVRPVRFPGHDEGARSATSKQEGEIEWQEEQSRH